MLVTRDLIRKIDACYVSLMTKKCLHGGVSWFRLSYDHLVSGRFLCLSSQTNCVSYEIFSLQELFKQLV